MGQIGHFLGLIVGGLPIAPHAQRKFTAKPLKKLKGSVTRTIIDHQDARHPLGMQVPQGTFEHIRLILDHRDRPHALGRGQGRELKGFL